MIFSSKKALNRLLKDGWVITFRKNRRKRIGKDWAKIDRLGSRVCYIFIEELGFINNLEHLDNDTIIIGTGFKNHKEWMEEIKRLNRDKLPKDGWLYLVFEWRYYQEYKLHKLCNISL